MFWLPVICKTSNLIGNASKIYRKVNHIKFFVTLKLKILKYSLLYRADKATEVWQDKQPVACDLVALISADHWSVKERNRKYFKTNGLSARYSVVLLKVCVMRDFFGFLDQVTGSHLNVPKTGELGSNHHFDGSGYYFPYS